MNAWVKTEPRIHRRHFHKLTGALWRYLNKVANGDISVAGKSRGKKKPATPQAEELFVIDQLTTYASFNCEMQGDFLVIRDWDGEKLGDWLIRRIHIIAPFVENGGEIRCEGEDGEDWCWLFTAGHVLELQPTVIWEHEQVYEIAGAE